MLSSGKGLVIELCDADGNPSNILNPNNFNFLIKPVGYDTIQDLPSLTEGDKNDLIEIIESQQGVYTDQGGDKQLLLWKLVLCLGTGNPNDQWAESSVEPNTWFGDDNQEYYPVGRIDSGDCFHTGKNDTETGFYNGNNINHNKLPYNFIQSTHDTYLFPLSSSVEGNINSFKNRIPIPNSSVTLHAGDISNIEAIKVSLNLREYLDLLFVEDGVDFTQNYETTSRFHSSANEYNDCVAANLNSGGSWGDYPPHEMDDLDIIVPYDSINGNDVLFGFHLDIGKRPGTGGPMIYENIDMSFSPDYYDNLFSSSNPMFISKVFTFNSIGYEDPVFTLFAFPGSVEFDSTAVNEGESITGNFGFGIGGFTGTVIARVFDSSDVDDIPEEFLELDNFHVDDDVANHGEVSFNEGAIPGGALITLASGDLIYSSLSYIANEVGVAGAEDDFSLFITLDTIDVSEVGSGTDVGMQDHWQDYFDGLELEDKTWKISSQPITINDIPEEGEAVEGDYNPSDIMVENPADVIFHLVEQELRYNKNINADKIIEARDNHSGWKYAFSINEEIDSKKLLQEMAQSTKLIPTFNNNTFSYAHVKTAYRGGTEYYDDGTIEEISEIKASDVIKYSVSRTDLEKLYTEVEVQYKYDYGLENHLGNTGKKKINTDFFQNAYGVTMNYGQFLDYVPAEDEKNNYYGLDFDKETNILKHEDTSLIFKSDYIRDEGTADLLANHLLLFHSNQHNIIEMTLPLKYYNVEVGDLVEFDEMIMGRKLYGEKYVLDEVNEDGKFVDMPIRCGQYILPLFMVTDITKTLKNVKIKVIQMHHLSSDALSWKGEDYMTTELPTEPEEEPLLGDMNGDGNLNVLDIVTMVTLVLGSTFLAIGDMNQDGALNVLDVVNLVNTVLNP